MLYNNNYKRQRGEKYATKGENYKRDVIDAAFEIARSEGAENNHATNCIKKIRLFHSPVMYHLK